MLVSGNLSFSVLSAGQDHVCGLVADGTAYCWGWNIYGQLGTGPVGGNYPEPAASSAPLAVLGGLKFADISGGGQHTCALTTTGAAYCWGDNNAGKLGTGTTGGAGLVPAPVTGKLAFASIRAAEGHTCALTSAGVAYCWGDNSYQELGDSTKGGSSNYPVAVAGGLSFSTIAASGYHTCGLVSGGQAYCWGAADYGELGTVSPVKQAPRF
jgi:alpha-tubulin suppressor-like RCC1 family protein